MLCSHGVGTSHLVQAPSIRPNPSKINSRKAILLSRIAITPSHATHMLSRLLAARDHAMPA
jgi:hypothetical protein